MIIVALFSGLLLGGYVFYKIYKVMYPYGNPNGGGPQVLVQEPSPRGSRRRSSGGSFGILFLLIFLASVGSAVYFSSDQIQQEKVTPQSPEDEQLGKVYNQRRVPEASIYTSRNLIEKVEPLSKVEEVKPESNATKASTELVNLRDKQSYVSETKGAYYVVLKADNTLEGALKQARKQKLIWQEHQIYVASVDRKKWNFKILVLFPYESMAQNFIDANSSNNFFHLNNEVLAFYQF